MSISMLLNLKLNELLMLDFDAADKFPDIPTIEYLHSNSQIPVNVEAINNEPFLAEAFQFSVDFETNAGVQDSNTSVTQPNNVKESRFPNTFTIGTATEEIPSTCRICQDQATGKHYGVMSCDGCKGFFRRSIRRNQSASYICSGSRRCLVNKQKRNKCRFCRLQKCYRAGMKAEAIQETRDKITIYRKKVNYESPVDELSINVLLKASGSVSLIQSQNYPSSYTTLSRASLEQIYEAMAEQLDKMVSWTELIPAFQTLHPQDKELLLRSHATEHLVLGVAYRSACLKENIILLSNCKFIEKDYSVNFDEGNKHITASILEQLLDQLRALSMDEVEYLLLKAIKLFNPDVKNLCNPSVVRDLRKKLLVALEDHVSDRLEEHRGRVGEIMLIIPTVMAVASILQNQLCACDLMLNNSFQKYKLLYQYLIKSS